MLALADAQGGEGRLGVEVKVELGGQAFQFAAGPGPVGKEGARAAQEKVIEHGERRKVQRVLVKHPHAQGDGLGGRGEAHRPAIQEDFPPVGGEVSGEHLHERALPGAVFPQEAVDGARFDAKGDAVVGPHRSEVFVDLAQFDLHLRAYKGRRVSAIE